jgi:hypothetical protein
MHIEKNQRLGRVLREVVIFLGGVGISLYVVDLSGWVYGSAGMIASVLLVVVIVVGYISRQMLVE